MGKGEFTTALSLYSLSTFLPPFPSTYLGQCHTNATRLIAACKTASALLHRTVLPCKAQASYQGCYWCTRKQDRLACNPGILPSSTSHQWEGQAGTTSGCAPGTDRSVGKWQYSQRRVRGLSLPAVLAGCQVSKFALHSFFPRDLVGQHSSRTGDFPIP